MDTYTKLLAAMIFLCTLYIGFAVWFAKRRRSVRKPERLTGDWNEAGELSEIAERHGMSEAICRAFLGERRRKARRIQ